MDVRLCSAPLLLLSLLLLAPNASAQSPDDPAKQRSVEVPTDDSLMIVRRLGGAASASCAPSLPVPDSTDLVLPSTPHMGSADASVEAVIFYDVNCPYCRQFHTEVYKALRTSYDSTQVAFYFRPFPISRSSVAPLQTLYYADSQGQFSTLLEAYYTLSLNGPRYTKRAAYFYSKASGLPFSSLAESSRSSALREKVLRSMDLGSAAGVKGTPTVIVNGRKVATESMNQTCISSLIEDALATSDDSSAGDDSSAAPSSPSASPPED